jgi:predicted dehydrogenase
MIRVALIGTGGIALANHVPGVALCPEARIVALCDLNPVALERAAQATGVSNTSTDPMAVARDEGVDAVIIATSTTPSRWPRYAPASTCCARSRSR